MMSASIAQEIWDKKYRFKTLGGASPERTREDTLERVASAVAAAEAPEARNRWQRTFSELLQSGHFLPAGRILSGAGTERHVTLFNCFVMGELHDSMAGILDGLKEGALTLQQGGGVGFDFSTLRPKGAPVKGVGADASGPVSFMEMWDAMCATVMSAGARRGAMMGTLRCDHPDIFRFIEAKHTAGALTNFNLSVLVTDRFMEAVEHDRSWDLTFEGHVYNQVRARDVWEAIMASTYETAEPGVIFIDRINEQNNLAYCETISATNPCGEQPLPPYGACLLGSINLARLVDRPFEADAALDEDAFAEAVGTAVRFLDNVIEISGFPLEVQKREAHLKRRIGLGVTGLANAFAMVGARYGSERSLKLTRHWFSIFRRHAYRASAELAAERGAFPLYDENEMLNAPTLQALDGETRNLIAGHGLRNGLLTSIAPTGTISLFAGNVSSGLEPTFAHAYTRKVRQADGSVDQHTVEDYAYALYRKRFGADADLPDHFITALELNPREHLAVQAAAQPFVDAAISKTVNCPADMSFDDFKSVYQEAYAAGLKGCTTYRPTPTRGSVLSTDGGGSESTSTKTSPVSDERREQSVGETGSTQHTGSADIVQLSEPLQRDDVLEGRTYKLKWPASDHAIYVTINDIVQDGRRRPFEVFINSKNMEHFPWTVALTRMISAVFRRGGDVSFVVEELQAVFDPRGGAWMHGHYVPSLLAAIGDVVERHLLEIGFLSEPLRPRPPRHSASTPDKADENSHRTMIVPTNASRPGRGCPRCGAPALVRAEGCDVCLTCGQSTCE